MCGSRRTSRFLNVSSSWRTCHSCHSSSRALSLCWEYAFQLLRSCKRVTVWRCASPSQHLIKCEDVRGASPFPEMWRVLCLRQCVNVQILEMQRQLAPLVESERANATFETEVVTFALDAVELQNFCSSQSLAR